MDITPFIHLLGAQPKKDAQASKSSYKHITPYIRRPLLVRGHQAARNTDLGLSQDVVF